MAKPASGIELIEILVELNKVPFNYTSRREALKRVTELGKKAMGSHTFTLAFIDLVDRTMVQEACSSDDERLEEFLTRRELRIGSRQKGDNVDIDVIKEGIIIDIHDLQSGNRVANPEIAKKYKLNSLLSYPLLSDGDLIGYINHFSSKIDTFTKEEKHTLNIFALQAMIVIERLEYQRTLNNLVNITNDLSKNLLSIPPEDFLKTVSEKACELLSVPICIIWEQAQDGHKLKIVATYGEVDEEYKKLEIYLDDPRIENRLFNREITYTPDISQVSTQFVQSEEVTRRGWVSLLSTPLRVGDNTLGMLDVFTKNHRSFKGWEKDIFQTFAYHAALALQKIQLLRETEEKKKLQKLSDIMLELSETDDVDELLKLFLEGSLELVGAKRGSISLLDYDTGYLNIVADSGNLPKKIHLKYGHGITGQALEREEPIRITDVKDSIWENAYSECWHETQSELAIPILLNGARIQVNREVVFGPKPIGVLNIESPHPNFFSKTDEDCLWSLACYAAVMIEKLEFDQKLNDLRMIEREIADVPDFDLVINTLMRGITDAMGFEYVNISLIDPESKIIRTEYLIGMDKDQEEKFKKMAIYSLDSDDIHADIVRSKEIEVPSATDVRLDHNIFYAFGHYSLVRVFLPMIESSKGHVIGTVETGYRKQYRKYIYERDVQILKRFVDYTADALQKKRYGLLDQISHEFKTPIVGIRSHASYLQRHINELPQELIQHKFDDIITDCELLLYQVGELEYILGLPRRKRKLEKTLVFRDIIIKTISQLKPIIRERGFATSKIEYKGTDIGRIKIVTDKAKLNQVVFNLLINSIKYAEDDPKNFTIRLELDETREYFILKFKDWGIGIKNEYVVRVFDNGFRSPEAMEKDIRGSGLGITISKTIMQELGGDLVLACNYKPTEFHLILPKEGKRRL